MSEKMYCPRAIENGGGPDSPFHPPFNGEMHWREDDSCSYCGSLNPDTFMKRLEAGDINLGPTDKNYKVYVHNAGGESFKQTYRKDCDMGKPGSKCTGPDDCVHWVTRDTAETKFYFQHLSVDQQKRFVELINERKVIIDYPGYFYRLPFFIKHVKK